MSRLRKKYKKLKEEYDRLRNQPVPVRYIFQENNVHTLGFDQRVTTDHLPIRPDLLSQIDQKAAKEFGKAVVERGFVKKELTYGMDYTTITYRLQVVGNGS